MNGRGDGWQKSEDILYTFSARSDASDCSDSLIDSPEQRSVGEDDSQTIADRFETNVLISKRVREEWLLVAKTETARHAHAPHLEMIGVLGRRES